MVQGSLIQSRARRARHAFLSEFMRRTGSARLKKFDEVSKESNDMYVF